ncbi:hypothetical protein NFJ02_07g131470 [Pycnococcus provasolii]
MLVVVAVLLVLTSGQLTAAAPAAESQPTRAHIMVATPCYTGTVHEGYFLSVVGALQRIEKSPTAPRLSVSTVAHIADLPKARGALISQFLNSKHYTHVAFVDADIAFDASLPERLVSSGFDVVAAMYAKKAIDVEKLRKGVSVSASLEYPVEFLFEKKPDGKQASRNEQGTARTDKRGFIEVRRAGAGFLMVSRSAIERLVKAHPELHYRDPTSGDVHYALFHNLLREYTAPDGKPDRTWVSEDYAFCDRWRAIGGEIWVDVVSDLNHTGRFVYPSSQWLDRFRTAPAQSSAGEL